VICAELSGVREGHGELDREGVSFNVEAARAGERTLGPAERIGAAADRTFHRENVIAHASVATGTCEGNLNMIAVDVGEKCPSLGVLDGEMSKNSL